MNESPVDVAAIRAALAKASPGPWVADYRWDTIRDVNDEFAVGDAPEDDARLIVLLRNNAEALLDALDRAQAASDGVAALRLAAEAWANVEVPEGRWSAGEIADWLSIKADLISEGGDF